MTARQRVMLRQVLDVAEELRRLAIKPRAATQDDVDAMLAEGINPGFGVGDLIYEFGNGDIAALERA